MKKHRETIEKLDKVERVLRQFLHGLRITDLAKKIETKRPTVYGYLNTLELEGRAYYQRGIAYPERPSSSSGKLSLSKEDLKDMRSLLSEARNSYFKPQVRIRENGTSYLAHTYAGYLRELAERHPLLKEQLRAAIWNSRALKSKGIETNRLAQTELDLMFPSLRSVLSPAEVEGLFGKLERVLDKLEANRL